jgi:3-phosphoglycerate kinase
MIIHNVKRRTKMLMKKELIENNKILLWENRKQKEEIERLNNNWNELEDYVIENSFGSPIHNTSVIELSKLLDKIKELKGEDKE